jgi:hypothetical protein
MPSPTLPPPPFDTTLDPILRRVLQAVYDPQMFGDNYDPYGG